MPDPAFFGALVGLGGCSSCSSPTAMMSTWISLWPSRCLSACLGEEGRGRDRERDGGHTISASASASRRCSGVWECWWVRSDESRGKERSQAEQLNWERDCDERECIWGNESETQQIKFISRQINVGVGLRPTASQQRLQPSFSPVTHVY